MKLFALHIGFPKCGSSHLQNQIFPFLGNKYCFFYKEFESILIKAFSTIGTYQWNEQGFINELNELFLNTNKLIICSSEILTGTHQYSDNDFAVLEILLKNFQFQNVIVVLRDPYEYIWSTWSQQVKEGGLHSLRKYLRSISRPTKRYNKTIIHKINYELYIDQLSLKSNNSLIVVKYDSIQLEERILKCLNIKEKCVNNNEKELKRLQQSLSLLGLRVMLLLNRFTETKRSPGPLPFKFYFFYRKLLSKLYGKNTSRNIENRIQKYLNKEEKIVLSKAQTFFSQLDSIEYGYNNDARIDPPKNQ